VENDTLITGYRITNGWARTNYTYFAISFSKPITEYGYKERDKLLYKGFWRRFKQDKNFPEIAGKDVAAYFHFDTKSGEELVAKVALSAVSTEGALKNLKAEAEGKNFEQLVAQAQESWNKELSMFSVEVTEQ
jgi:putative alpha-1,2-mannosidase